MADDLYTIGDLPPRFYEAEKINTVHTRYCKNSRHLIVTTEYGYSLECYTDFYPRIWRSKVCVDSQEYLRDYLRHIKYELCASTFGDFLFKNDGIYLVLATQYYSYKEVAPGQYIKALHTEVIAVKDPHQVVTLGGLKPCMF